MKNVCICIPCRFNSSRLPGKLTYKFGDEYTIVKTYLKAKKSKYASEIFLLIDDKKIYDIMIKYTDKILYTDVNCKNGTERISKNLNKISNDYNVIVNIQADEPFVSHLNIDFCIDKHLENNNENVFYTTLHEQENSDEYLKSTASLKVICDKFNNVIYYSRNLIPFNKKGVINPNIIYNTFTGIYVYNRDKILKYSDLDDTILQNEEDCEQLKLIENGLKIKSYKTIEYNEISLNTEEDYKFLKNKYESSYLKKKYNLLDCTLRDGGYINNWRFTDDFLNEYIKLMEDSNIDYVEIGFINKKTTYKNKVVGKYRNIDEEYLNLFTNVKFKVVVLADFQNINLDILRNKNSKKIIDLVRIAFHKKNLNESIKVANYIKELGYNVSLNAMAITNYDNDELNNLFNLINKNNFDILYIADSYGSLNNEEISDYLTLFNEKLINTNIGIHLHNNMNNAFSNYLRSKITEVDKILFIDSTIFGMGRGAGNLQTELVLNNLEVDKKIIIEYFIFIDKFLMISYNNNKKTNWGYNIDYFISGLLKTHPNYINQFRDLKLSFSNILFLINIVIENNKHNYFDKEYVTKLVNLYNNNLV